MVDGYRSWEQSESLDYNEIWGLVKHVSSKQLELLDYNETWSVIVFLEFIPIIESISSFSSIIDELRLRMDYLIHLEDFKIQTYLINSEGIFEHPNSKSNILLENATLISFSSKIDMAEKTFFALFTLHSSDKSKSLDLEVVCTTKINPGYSMKKVMN